MKGYITTALIATFTLTLGTYATALTTPFFTATAFTDNEPPEQSCFPPGIDESHTGQNPNCYDGRIPNCVAVANGNSDGASGCRNRGTCSEPGTPACPSPDDDDDDDDDDED